MFISRKIQKKISYIMLPVMVLYTILPSASYGSDVYVVSKDKMNCNRLKGKLGDKLNAILSACGFNFRKLLRAIALFFVFVLKMPFFAFWTEKKHPQRLTFAFQSP